MNSWDDNDTKEAMRASAAILANFSTQLQVRLAADDYNMTPDEALFLLRQITGFAESMIHLAEQASPK